MDLGCHHQSLMKMLKVEDYKDQPNTVCGPCLDSELKQLQKDIDSNQSGKIAQEPSIR